MYNYLSINKSKYTSSTYYCLIYVLIIVLTFFKIFYKRESLIIEIYVKQIKQTNFKPQQI